MPRFLAVVVLFLLCVPNAVSQTKSADPRLMSDADYKTLLSKIETDLPKLEAALKNIDPAKNSQISYSLGQMIVQNRDAGLMEIENIWPFAASERQKRTVYGELALSNFLQSLFESVAEEVAAEAIENVTLSHLENYAPELSTFQARLSADALARVKLLEKGICPK
jgi:hypothetical protein